MTLKDLELGITGYCEQRIAPMLRSSVDKWALYFGLGILATKMEALFQTVAPMASAAGIIDGDGNIDLGLLENVGYAAFEKQPRVQLWKLTFAKEDWGDFIRFIRQQ